MAIDKAIDSAALESGLSAVANAIRVKGGTSAPLAFPDGFVTAVAAISATTEGEIVLFDEDELLSGMRYAWAATSDGSGICTIGNDVITLETTKNKTRKGAVLRAPIVMDGYKLLSAEVEIVSCTAGTSQIRLGYHDDVDPTVGTGSGTATCSVITLEGTGNMMVTYDVSDVEGEMYPWIALANAGVAQVHVHRVWLSE